MRNYLYLFFIIPISLFCQNECGYLAESSSEKQACELYWKGRKTNQGSKASLKLFDSAIAVNPKFALAYHEKSVPYFKRGFLSEGLEILNNAIQLDSISYLPYRAYWYFQYQYYQKCIDDMNAYYQLVPNNQYVLDPAATMDMRTLTAISQYRLGNKELAIRQMKNYIESKEFMPDFYIFDYYILAQFYFSQNDYENALNYCNLAIENTPGLKPAYEFKAKILERTRHPVEAQEALSKAKSLIGKEETVYSNPYIDLNL